MILFTNINDKSKCQRKKETLIFKFVFNFFSSNCKKDDNDDVDIVAHNDKEKKEHRRTDRWFQLNKNKFNNDADGLEIKQDKEKKLNYRHFSHLEVKSDDDNIYIPIENPFLAHEKHENDNEKSETITVLKKLHSNENNEGMVISFIKEEKILIPVKAKKTKNRSERERYKKIVQKEQFGDKKYVKLKEKNANESIYLKKFKEWVKKILTRK